MRLLAVASDKAELRGFPDSWTKIVCGTGPVLAAAVTAAALAEARPDVVFSVGSAGSLGSLKVGDCVSFGSVVCPDQDLTPFHLARGAALLPSHAVMGSLRLDRASELVLSSSGAFAASRNVPIAADAADMEAYGVAAAAYLAGVPCFAVKVITDVAGERISLPEYGFTLRSLRSLLFPKAEEVLRGL